MARKTFEQEIEAVARDLGVDPSELDEDMVVTGEYFWEPQDGYTGDVDFGDFY